jgi:hypothetical protein
MLVIPVWLQACVHWDSFLLLPALPSPGRPYFFLSQKSKQKDKPELNSPNSGSQPHSGA